ncbi:hypothetical protein ACK8N7_36525 [Streptomyces griseobrunneus]
MLPRSPRRGVASAQVPPDWSDPEVGELILGPGVRIPADRLEQLGYVNRVKFITDGHRRVLVLGTEVFGESTVWGIDLEDCEITEDGRLKTPVSDAHRAPGAVGPRRRPRRSPHRRHSA